MQHAGKPAALLVYYSGPGNPGQPAYLSGGAKVSIFEEN